MARGYEGLVPYLTIRGGKASAAIDFYRRAFGATELRRANDESGQKIMHAHLKVNGSDLFLSDDFPEFRGGQEAPAPGCVTLHLEVDDADRWWGQALEAGAQVKMPLADQFWGDRYGQLSDPFGHAWSIASPVKDKARG